MRPLILIALLSVVLGQTTTPAPCWTPQLSDQMGSGGGWLMFGIGILSTLIVAGLIYFLCTLRWKPEPTERAASYPPSDPNLFAVYSSPYGYYPVVAVPP